MRIQQRWPRDSIREPHRDLGSRIAQEILTAYPSEPGVARIRDLRRCEMALRGLEEIVENKHKTEFPVNLQIGVFGVPRDAIRGFTTEEFTPAVGWKEKLTRAFAKQTEKVVRESKHSNPFKVPYTFSVKHEESETGNE